MALDRGIAYRRHHYNRLKANRQRNSYWGKGRSIGYDWCPASLGIAINTPKPNSCYCCSHVRDFEGDTLGEKRHEVSLRKWDY